jgi:four helix bundle protein
LEGEDAKVDLVERTFEFARRVLKSCQMLDQTPGVSRTLAAQLLRAGTSIGANVEEAQTAQSRADYLNKLSIARNEARETHCWLRLLTASEIVQGVPPDQPTRRVKPTNRHSYHHNQKNQEQPINQEVGIGNEQPIPTS